MLQTYEAIMQPSWGLQFSDQMPPKFDQANIAPPLMRKQISEDRVEFETALKSLEASGVTSPKIVQELTVARGQWLFYQNALDSKDKALAIRDVASTSERVLEVMDGLVNLYDAALREVLGKVAQSETTFALSG